jgi:hypothetical protein
VTELVLEPGELVAEHDDAPGGRGTLGRVARPLAALRAVPALGTWAGVLVSVVGLGLIALAWGRTAGLTEVALQVPYVISAGATGLGLVVVGAGLVSISAKRADARARSEQLSELRTLVVELRAALEERS